jgi:histone acetyltransferase (RNA polymerase elongator complex component)
VQLGVQHTNEQVIKKINRDCTKAEVKAAIRRLKNACFKVDIHLMPNLPGCSLALDEAMFEEVLQSPDLQADQWKIYPCEIVPWTVIKKWHDEGTFTPYTLLIHYAHPSPQVLSHRTPMTIWWNC